MDAKSLHHVSVSMKVFNDEELVIAVEKLEEGRPKAGQTAEAIRSDVSCLLSQLRHSGIIPNVCCA